MWVQELWRYPVKSMGGERLETAELGLQGIRGDRVVLVRGPQGRVMTARTRHMLLGNHALLGADGEPRVDGRPWASAEVALDVEAAAGPGARLVRSGPERFDILPLLVATDGAIAEFGYDRRRLRPNLVVGGVPGLAERGWEGRVLRVGEALIGVQDLRDRCVMTTFDPDTLAQDVEVFRRIRDRFGGSLALNCYVMRAGRIRMGDPVELVEATQERTLREALGQHERVS